MFGQQLKRLRIANGLTQKEFSEKMSKAKSTVANWENENIMPSVDVVVKIADFFSVTVDYLLGRALDGRCEGNLIDAIGLTTVQIAHIQQIVDDIRGKDLSE